MFVKLAKERPIPTLKKNYCSPKSRSSTFSATTKKKRDLLIDLSLKRYG